MHAYDVVPFAQSFRRSSSDPGHRPSPCCTGSSRAVIDSVYPDTKCSIGSRTTANEIAVRASGRVTFLGVFMGPKRRRRENRCPPLPSNDCMFASMPLVSRHQPRLGARCRSDLDPRPDDHGADTADISAPPGDPQPAGRALSPGRPGAKASVRSAKRARLRRRRPPRLPPPAACATVRL